MSKLSVSKTEMPSFLDLVAEHGTVAPEGLPTFRIPFFDFASWRIIRYYGAKIRLAAGMGSIMVREVELSRIDYPGQAIAAKNPELNREDYAGLTEDEFKMTQLKGEYTQLSWWSIPYASAGKARILSVDSAERQELLTMEQDKVVGSRYLLGKLLSPAILSLTNNDEPIDLETILASDPVPYDKKQVDSNCSRT